MTPLTLVFPTMAGIYMRFPFTRKMNTKTFKTRRVPWALKQCLLDSAYSLLHPLPSNSVLCEALQDSILLTAVVSSVLHTVGIDLALLYCC